MPSISIATFNINSIKARLPNLLAWLDANPVDVLLLQETKCEDHSFPTMELEDKGYNLAFHGQKTYNGVAICSKFPLEDVTRGLGGDDADEQARYIEAIASIPGGAIRLASAYVPNGQDPESDKFVYKLKFYDRLRAHWAQQVKLYEMAALGGDFNCAPEPLDVYDPRKSEGAICYHPEERWRLRALMNLGLYDAFRIKNPSRKQFSWWDYRGGSYEHNIGLRIDHILLSAPAVDRLETCEIDEIPRQQKRPSDHTPVIVKLAA